MVKYLTLLLFVVTFLACQSTNSLVEFEVLRPAKFTVPPEIKSIVLVNNAYPFENNDVHMAIVNGEKQNLDTINLDGYPDSVLVSLRHTLLYEHFFDTVYFDTLNYNLTDKGEPLKKLKLNEVQTLCDKHNAEAVLALEGYAYGTIVRVDEHPDGFYSSMAVHGLTYWRMYDAYSNEVVFSEVQRDTIYWNGLGSSIDVSLLTFPSLKEANLEYAFYIGGEFVKLIVPEWEKVERSYFIEGNGYFEAATDWMNRKNTEEAKKLWGYVYEHGSKLDKARAAHNIAVTLEREGDVFNAMKWGFKSYEAYKYVNKSFYSSELKDAEKYYVYLTHRNKELETLIKQVGGSE